jgi:hypothetical protein
MIKLNSGFGLYSSKELNHGIWITKDKESLFLGNSAKMLSQNIASLCKPFTMYTY